MQMSRDPRRMRQILTLPQRFWRYLVGQPKSKERLRRLFYDIAPPISYYVMRYREKHPGPKHLDAEERMMKFLEKKNANESLQPSVYEKMGNFKKRMADNSTY